ncbi:RimJ/RimL family protein N-acetyltransferase [Acinetobacter calcoaceticus]|uniref:RimJ/RimL family protein N-acetyltransferase n=1 Tax=Acinetobacter calcoaceticus TaxID=471 RepID=A0A4R1Y069_ACICA|nr:RimJ/RimL family protein N-acetyltransferase [Acinetobacter calcoaceticus]
MTMQQHFDLVAFTDTASDFQLYLQLVSDIEVMQMITERAIAEPEAVSDYAKLLSNNALLSGCGNFKIIDAGTQQFIGLAKLEVDHRDAAVAELGYMLLPVYWGQGIASQIAKQLIQQAQSLPQLCSLTAIIDPKHAASRKVLSKHGFESAGFEDYDGLPAEILNLSLAHEIQA